MSIVGIVRTLWKSFYGPIRPRDNLIGRSNSKEIETRLLIFVNA